MQDIQSHAKASAKVGLKDVALTGAGVAIGALIGKKFGSAATGAKIGIAVAAVASVTTAGKTIDTSRMADLKKFIKGAEKDLKKWKPEPDSPRKDKKVNNREKELARWTKQLQDIEKRQKK